MYYNREQRTKRFLKELEQFAHSVVGDTLGGNQDEDKMRILLNDVLQHFPAHAGRVHIDYEPFLRENFISTDPVELKRLLREKNGK